MRSLSGQAQILYGIESGTSNGRNMLRSLVFKDQPWWVCQRQEAARIVGRGKKGPVLVVLRAETEVLIET